MESNWQNKSVVYDSGYVPLFVRIICVLLGLALLGISATMVAAGLRIIDVFPTNLTGFNLWWKVSLVSLILFVASITFLQVWFERISLVLDRQAGELTRISALMLWTRRRRIPITAAKSVKIACSLLLATPAWDVKLMLNTDKCFWLARLYTSESAIELAEDISMNLHIPLTEN